ncbi:MAG: hypothetical protein AVDCRST_MAG50-2758, partial [uncultured Acidimicrobiales bacterium]
CGGREQHRSGTTRRHSATYHRATSVGNSRVPPGAGVTLRRSRLV